jgi:hypothetical protein
MAGTAAANDNNSNGDAWSNSNDPGVANVHNGEHPQTSAAMKAQAIQHPLLQPAPPLRAASVQLWLSQIDTGTHSTRNYWYQM